MTKKKIYLVSTGSYSDWSIVGLFTKHEDAEELRKLLDESNDVEVWELDKHLPKNGTPFYVRSLPNSIEIAEVSSEATSGYSWREAGHVIPTAISGYHITVIARDPSHAAKIAADKFREYKATHP